jgi:hypothetical protein
VRKKILSLVAGTLAFGGLAAIVSHYIWPAVPIPLFSLVAAGVCLIPSTLTLLWADRIGSRQAESQLLIILGGTAVRMALVLGVGLLLFYSVPFFERMSFGIVLLIFYLFTLSLEIAIVVSGPMSQEKQKQIR